MNLSRYYLLPYLCYLDIKYLYMQPVLHNSDEEQENRKQDINKNQWSQFRSESNGRLGVRLRYNLFIFRLVTTILDYQTDGHSSSSWSKESNIVSCSSHSKKEKLLYECACLQSFLWMQLIKIKKKILFHNGHWPMLG